MTATKEESLFMAIAVSAVHPNLTIQVPGLGIYTGIVECLFKGTAAGVSKDTLSFIIPPPRVSLAIQPFQASCVVSLASFAYDGVITDALWAVDNTSVNTVNEDRGSGTAQVQVFANLAVRGLNGMILRVNYSLFVKQ
jgi:hypothetical protein